MENERERFDDCQLCCELYDENRRPRVLSCGHSYCTDCVEKLLKNEAPSCPICNANIRALNISEISINEDLEQCILNFRRIEYEKASWSHPAHRNKKMQKLVDLHRSCAQDLLDYAKELSDDLQFYLDFLVTNIERHEKIEEELKERVEWHKDIVKKMEAEQSSVGAAKQQAKTHIEDLEAALAKLESKASSKETAGALAKLTEIYGELVDFADKCQEDYPDPIVSKAQKLLKPAGNLFIESVDYEEEIHSCSGYPESSPVSEKVCLTLMEEYFQASDLKRKPDEWKKKILTGKVFVEHETYEKRTKTTTARFANISIKDDQLYLPCLQKVEPPLLSFKVLISEILECLKKPNVVFLDIAWDRLQKGRVLIELTPGSPLAEHFLFLCTGKLGPSYLNKKFTKVVYPDTNTERIGSEPYGGSFINGRVTLESLEIYSRAHSRHADQGIVWMEPDFSFFILTGLGRDCTYNGVFGQVIYGLKLLEESAKRVADGLLDVEIVNTGALLKL